MHITEQDGTGAGASRILLKPLVNMFDAIIFKKVRENFGGRLKFFIGGGALLDIELQRFFYAWYSDVPGIWSF
jgi:long-chain acyl-CoA synthetase